MTNTAAAAVWASRVVESSCGYSSSLALLPSFRRRFRDLDSSGRGGAQIRRRRCPGHRGQDPVTKQIAVASNWV